MATHDYVISNASGAAVRADLNNVLAAIVTNNSSATAPTTTYAYQWWADTGSSPAVMKLRNAANSAWITLFQLDGEWSTLAVENGTAAAPSIYFKDSGTDTGFYSPGTDQIGISTGGTSAVVVDASQRLLVGTSTARAVGSPVTWKAQIEGLGTDTGFPGLGITYNNNDSECSYIVLAKSRGTSIGSSTVVQNNDRLGIIAFAGADGTDIETRAAEIICAVDGTPGANDMPGRLVFSTTADGASSPTERMRIRESGYSTFVSTSNAIGGSTTAAAGFTAYVFVGRHSATAGNPASGTDCILIAANGNVLNANNSYGALSDIKLKENIVDAGSQWSDIKALQVRKYNFKEGQTHTQIGLVAQEVELVSPGLVNKSPDRDAEGNDLGTVTKSVNYSVLYMKAVKALQEAMERIETLETKVAALEAA